MHGVMTLLDAASRMVKAGEQDGRQLLRPGEHSLLLTKLNDTLYFEL